MQYRHKLWMMLAAAGVLHLATAHAQDTNTNQNPASDHLFRASFKASSQGVGNARERVRDRDVIANCLGRDSLSASDRKDYALVYNPAADSLQVVRAATGELVCDVLNFSGGTSTAGSRGSERLTYVYLPGQGESIGSAVITEKLSRSSNNGDIRRAKITGRLQFTLPAGVELGQHNNNGEAVAAGNLGSAHDLGSTNNSGLGPDTGAGSGSGSGSNDGSGSSGAHVNLEPFFSVRSAQATLDNGARVYIATFAAGKRLDTSDTGSGSGAGAGSGAGGNDGSGGNNGDTNNWNASLNQQDINFIRETINLNHSEIRMGEILVQRGQTQAIRDYGQMLINDHTAALQELRALAESKGGSIVLPEVPAANQGVLNSLERVSDAGFDERARAAAISAHRAAINRHEREVRSGQDPDVVAWARNQLPVLEAHLQQAQTLNASTSS
jgi:putative membrane protein